MNESTKNQRGNKKNTWKQIKMKLNGPKSLGQRKSSSMMEVYSDTGLLKKRKKKKETKKEKDLKQFKHISKEKKHNKAKGEQNKIYI